MDFRVEQLLKKAQDLFGNESQPEHFTDHIHCCECADHDNTLQAYTPQSIGHGQLGNMAWDPICFVNEPAFRYYFPALTRLTLQGHGDTYYLDQFLFHVILDGPRNRRWLSFSSEQRMFVAELLEYMHENRAEEIDDSLDSDRLLEAILIWRDDGS